MKKTQLQFLSELLDAPSPSGYEGPARRVWCAALEGVADELTVDVHGNAIATLNPKGAPHVMLAGHIDEIGFLVNHIEESGLIRFQPIGGHDMRGIAGRRVWVHAASGPILGVVGKQPVHLMRNRDRSTSPPQASELWIDCGFQKKKEAADVVAIGDPITYVDSFALMRNDIAVARGFDNRVGAFVVAEVLRSLKRAKGLRARVSAVATVQEEIGLRGATTSAFGLAPDIGIAVDVTWATDNPGGNAREVGEVKLGAGPVLSRGANINPPLLALLEAAAKKANISYQLRASGRATGTDANAIQLTRGGVATALVSIPNRYMHSPVEICHLKDIVNSIKLIADTLRTLTPKTRLIPD
ncbi:MAG: M42 family metallopeptidase [Deltaproteobacteria bacterium]|nr:M42 family metallopeptidase [Deltaproteobacteria bacterium]